MVADALSDVFGDEATISVETKGNEIVINE